MKKITFTAMLICLTFALQAQHSTSKGTIGGNIFGFGR